MAVEVDTISQVVCEHSVAALTFFTAAVAVVALSASAAIWNTFIFVGGKSLVKELGKQGVSQVAGQGRRSPVLAHQVKVVS
jgi:hypothetical protein